MSSVASLVQTLAEGINQQNGHRLRALLRVDDSTTQEAVFGAWQNNPRWNPAAALSRLPDDWSEFLAQHWSCIVALQKGQREAAYDRVVAALQPFIRIFREDTDDWVVVLMHSVVDNLRSVAEAADEELRAAGKPAPKLADCGDQLRKCFSVALQAPGNKGKKLAALHVVNVSITAYFKLNTLRLCKNLTRTVDSRQFAPFEAFPKSQKVTYKFYLGRLAIFDENYQEASDSLEYALQHCLKTAARSKALILKYLVPVQLLAGKLPSEKLVEQYHLEQYVPLIRAMKEGDLALFDATMENKQFQFIQEGSYLLLQKLRQSVYRRLLKQVHAVHAQADPSKAAQIPLPWVQAALKAQLQANPTPGAFDQELEWDMDAVECVCANLIHRKYVRGYISHKNKVMVVAKTDPFPPLSTVAPVDA